MTSPQTDLSGRVLDRADDIVEVNLGNQTVTGNHALSAALDIVDARLPATVALSKVDAFLSVRGEFQITDTAETTVTLAAGHVRLTCVRANIRDTDLPATFRARCLARPQEWTADGQLKLRPVAIAEPDERGARSFAKRWQDTHGPLGHDERLVPRTFFVLGGGYDEDNLIVKDAVTCMRVRGPIAQQIHALPDGTRIRFDTG